MSFFLMIGMLISQNSFARMFSGTCDKYGWSVDETHDRGFIVLGHTHDFGAGSTDFMLLRLDPTGSLEWAKALGGPGQEYGCPVIQTSDLGFALAGWTNSFGAGAEDFLVIKLDPNGDLVWAKTIGGAGPDFPYSLTETADRYLIVSGWTQSFGSGGNDFLVVALDRDGTLVWAITFGEGGDDIALSSSVCMSGVDVWVAGKTTSYGIQYEPLIIRLDRYGNLMWASTCGVNGGEEPQKMYRSSIVSTEPGDGFVFAGETSSHGAGGFDALVIRGSMTELEWVRTIGGARNDAAFSLTQTRDGGFVIGGWTESFSAGAKDFLIAKMDEGGNIVWSNAFGGPDEDYVQFVAHTSDGGLVAAGTSYSFGVPITQDHMVLKLPADGIYSGCVQDIWPEITTPELKFNPVNGHKTCDPKVEDAKVEVLSALPEQKDLCKPLYDETEEACGARPGLRITCFPVPGAALFLSSMETGIAIYSVDGRVAYSGQLRKGENRISLEAGVYLWITQNPKPGTRNQKGKAVVR